MPLNMPPQPWEIVQNEAEKRRQWEIWVAENSTAINDLMKRVLRTNAPKDWINKLAKADPTITKQYQQLVEYDQWQDAYEDYHGSAQEDFSFKKGGKQLATVEARLARAAAFWDARKRQFGGDVNDYKTYLAARTSVDALAGTEEGKATIATYGYNNLVKAYQGQQEFVGLQGKAEFYQSLIPTFKASFGRNPTATEAENIMGRFGSAANYQGYLGAGQTAAAKMAEIEAGDLGSYMGGNITQEGLQEQIYAGEGASLQLKIDEARLRRQAIWKAGQSAAQTQLTEAGLLKQSLF